MSQLEGDEQVAWPSYVDVLSSFIFILLLFVSSSINFIADVAAKEELHRKLVEIASKFNSLDYHAAVEGDTVRVSLKDKVSFPLGRADLDIGSIINLRVTGGQIAHYKSARRIVVQGYADKVPGTEPFRNWELSIQRATAVLRFLYTCTDCGYEPADIQKKLVLRGEGDVASRALKFSETESGVSTDRRVDIVFDFGNGTDGN